MVTQQFNKYIYVAGPYSHPDPVINTKMAIEAGDILRSMGFVPFIPHLTMFWHLLKPHDLDYWYDYDNEWIRKCDALLRLPGESVGADKEVELMKKLNRPIYEILKQDGRPVLNCIG